MLCWCLPGQPNSVLCSVLHLRAGVVLPEMTCGYAEPQQCCHCSILKCSEPADALIKEALMTSTDFQTAKHHTQDQFRSHLSCRAGHAAAAAALGLDCPGPPSKGAALTACLC